MLAIPLPKILVVDDEPAMRGLLTQALKPVALHVEEAADAAVALEAIESGHIDVVLSDMHMPGATGLDLLTRAREAQWDLSFILITGRPETETMIAALRMEAADFLLKPFTLRDLTESVATGYRKLQTVREARVYRKLLESGLQRRTHDLEVALQSLEQNYQATLEALVASLDAREHETCAHSFRVRSYTMQLARAIGYPPALLPKLENAALLHDIGKIAVSDSILLKPGKLDGQEWVEMKKHPVAGEQIIRRISFLAGAAPIVRHHHERYDGAGYPDGLAGEQIPLGARVFAFADTLDAMTSDRSYRKAPGFEAALAEVERCAGKQFDPDIARVFLQMPIQTWQEIRNREGTANQPSAA